MPQVRVDGARAVVAGLARLEQVAPSVVAGPVRYATLSLQRRVRARASTGTHRPGAPHIPGTGPGPNVATGDYRRSIRVALGIVPARRGGVAPVGKVFTNAPQAYRLEHGFIGADSRGRTYRQRPYPHWGPAVDSLEPDFVQAMEEALDRALGDPT